MFVHDVCDSGDMMEVCVANVLFFPTLLFSLCSAGKLGLLQRQRRPAHPVRHQRDLQQTHHPELYQLLQEAEIQGKKKKNTCNPGDVQCFIFTSDYSG